MEIITIYMESITTHMEIINDTHGKQYNTMTLA